MFVPFSIGLLEVVPWRRKVIWGFQVVGLCVGLYLLYMLVDFPVTAVVADNIVYVSPHFYKVPVMLLYLIATCLSCFFSSDSKHNITANNHFRCSSIQYTSLIELLEFCNAVGIAPIINHKSFENKKFVHFSVVKNISVNEAIINDPENKNRIVVSFSELDLMVTKTSDSDEVGGKMAIIPTLEIFPDQSRACPHCGKDIDISFSCAANNKARIVNQDLCQSCDAFSLTP